MHRPSFFPFALIIPIFLISIWSVSAQNTGGIEKDFFPFSVWYSGGKARAPMLSNINDRSEEEWREDLHLKFAGHGLNHKIMNFIRCQNVSKRAEKCFCIFGRMRQLKKRVGAQLFAI